MNDKEFIKEYLDRYENALLKNDISLQFVEMKKMLLNVKTNGKKEVFLSGGRFDNLIKDLGNKKDLNAVGAAINRSIL